MTLFAFILATTSLPAFDFQQARTQCVKETDSDDFDAQAECLKSLVRDHREVSIVYRFAKLTLKASIEKCATEYSEDNHADWGLIQICTNRTDGLLTQTLTPKRPVDRDQARTHCQKEIGKRKDLTMDDCMRYELIGHRNFELFKAAYSDPALQSSFKICLNRWTADDGTDWDMAFYCAQDQLDGYERLGNR